MHIHGGLARVSRSCREEAAAEVNLGNRPSRGRRYGLHHRWLIGKSSVLYGLLLALYMDVRNILVYGNSQLIIRQVNNIYEVRKPELVPYHTVAQILMKKFEHIQLLHVPRSKNSSTDALAKLATALTLPEWEPAQVIIEERWILPAVLELIPQEYEVHHVVTNSTGDDDWRKPFLDYFNHGTLPDEQWKGAGCKDACLPM